MPLTDWWGAPVLLYIVLAFGLVRWMGKKYIVGTKRTKRLFLQFLTCFVGALAYATWKGWPQAPLVSWVVVWMVGMGSGVACFYNWKAQDISLGKTSVFTIWDDLIGMMLSYVILHEGEYLNGMSAAGVLCSSVALTLFAVHAFVRRGSRKALPMAYFGYVAVYSVIWGIALFSQRYFKVDGMPLSAFVVAWYAGAALTSLGLLSFMHESDPRQQGKLSPEEVVITVAYAVLILLSVGIAFWSYQSPQTIVQPIYFVSEAVVPTAIAFLFFGERAQYDKVEYVYLGLAITGVFLIFQGYTHLFS